MSQEKSKTIQITENEMNKIEGTLTIPDKGTHIKGIVIFAHGSGSSRFSPRNKYVAQILNRANIATLLIDLLTREEERVDDITREHRFDIGLLARRLVSCAEWVRQNPEVKDLRIGYFGASTGAAAALVAAAAVPIISAIVSRGGRPDLAGDEVLSRIEAPTLLIVGENDEEVITLNQGALEGLTKIEGKKKMVVVPGATHLFEEPGTLEEVARHATSWFERYFLE
ncbi:MAG TPA: dienelactone hydrolase family protein [Nitrososphaeraceae archaeon]|jgi:dienelactone hydrolase|nr:dienelactone hydrolase family protein [Nitrososphaeraceae archaeon]